MDRPSTDIHLDPSTAAREVTLRFDRWFAEHHLDLPPETRAEFVQMGMDALQRWPDRSSGDVLDELIAELDARLGRIVDEAGEAHDARKAASAATTGRTDVRADVARPGWLERLRRRLH